jgi:hypothetical protein
MRAYGRTDRRIGMPKLIFTFRSFENAPNKLSYVCEWTLSWNSAWLSYETLYLLNGYWDAALNADYAKCRVCMKWHLTGVPHHVHTMRHTFVKQYQLYSRGISYRQTQLYVYRQLTILTIYYYLFKATCFGV